MDLKLVCSFKIAVLLFVTQLITDCACLQCYDCSYFRLETGNSAVDTALSFFSQISDPACQFNEEDDRLDVDIKNCPEPVAGNVARCAVVKGTVSATLDTPLGDPQFSYYDVTRNCIEVPANDAIYEGCQTELASSTQQLVKETFEGKLLPGFSVENIEFDGEACYYDELTDSAPVMHPCNVMILAISVMIRCFMI